MVILRKTRHSSGQRFQQLIFQKRLSVGTDGKRCTLKTNHIAVSLVKKDIEIHQYDVSISPEVTSRDVSHSIMGQLVKLYRKSDLHGYLPAYDGMKILYTAGPLPFCLKAFEITLQDKEDSLAGEQPLKRRFKVTIKYAAQFSMRSLDEFCDGKQNQEPQAILQALHIILRELPTARYTLFAQSFCSPNFRECQQLGEGLDSWHGFYQSIRPTQMGLLLNIDLPSAVFIKPLPMIDFIAELLNRDISADISLSDTDLLKITEALKGVKVRIIYGGNMHEKHCVYGLASQAGNDRYGANIPLQYNSLPCLQVGDPQMLMPIEFCKIVEGQRYSKQLNEKQLATLYKVGIQHPYEREQGILQTVYQNKYNEGPHAKEFGIKIEEQLVPLEARILPPPWLKFNERGMTTKFLPRFGMWNMICKRMVNGGRVNSWTCINFSRNVKKNTASAFCRELASMCLAFGMDFSFNPVLSVRKASPEHLQRELEKLHKGVMSILRPQGRELDLLIAILPDNNGSLYGDLKRICETDIGLVSQCCLAKHVCKMNRQYLANVALKINVKVGGRNTVLLNALERKLPHVEGTPTIIFGAHVTHPHSGKDSSPSIASVVASQDWPEATKYAGLAHAQPHHWESINSLFKTKTGGMVVQHLMSFYLATGQKPQRIIFYRDGVSKGKFSQVLKYELRAIKMACQFLEPSYSPPVTYIVVQKCRHIQLFPDDYCGGVSGNIWPGTVVDSKICHPNELDFYLCSHSCSKAKSQGTSRPVHYHVLWDENKFPAGAFQKLTNYLCYTYEGCTHSISIVPPLRYAQRLSSRARCYIKPWSSEVGSTASGAATNRTSLLSSSVFKVRDLPAIKQNLKHVMFFC